MGLLDDLVNQAGKQLGQQPQGQGGSPAALLTTLTQLLGSGSGGVGGLAALVQLFERGGLGHIVQSWIGTGQNLPISPAQLQQVLGHGPLGQLASQTGMAPDALAQQLTHLLPQVVDHLTPNGQMPAQLDLGSAMGMLKKLL